MNFDVYGRSAWQHLVPEAISRGNQIAELPSGQCLPDSSSGSPTLAAERRAGRQIRRAYHTPQQFVKTPGSMPLDTELHKSAHKGGHPDDQSFSVETCVRPVFPCRKWCSIRRQQGGKMAITIKLPLQKSADFYSFYLSCAAETKKNDLSSSRVFSGSAIQ